MLISLNLERSKHVKMRKKEISHIYRYALVGCFSWFAFYDTRSTKDICAKQKQESLAKNKIKIKQFQEKMMWMGFPIQT